MTNEQVEREQVVRKIIGVEASPRQVQAMLEAVERLWPEWLAAIEDKHAQDQANLDAEYRELLEAAEQERDRECDARIAAENTAQKLQDKKSSLENSLIAANARVSQVDTQLGVRIRVILLEERIKELAAGQVKSFHHEIRARELQREVDRLSAEKARDNERIGELEPKALTFDFIAAWGELEDKLEPIKKELWEKQRRPNPPSTFDQLRSAREKGHISEHQRLHLKNMIAQRNDIAHEGLPLPSDMARANLKFLKEVIDQPWGRPGYPRRRE